jgi:hypothetical protein
MSAPLPGCCLIYGTRHTQSFVKSALVGIAGNVKRPNGSLDIPNSALLYPARYKGWIHLDIKKPAMQRRGVKYFGGILSGAKLP